MEKLIRNVDLAAGEVHATPETDTTFHKLLEKFHDAVWKVRRSFLCYIRSFLEKYHNLLKLWAFFKNGFLAVFRNVNKDFEKCSQIFLFSMFYVYFRNILASALNDSFK